MISMLFMYDYSCFCLYNASDICSTSYHATYYIWTGRKENGITPSPDMIPLLLSLFCCAVHDLQHEHSAEPEALLEYLGVCRVIQPVVALLCDVQ